MKQMIIYKLAKGVVFVPCDLNGVPDLSNVPRKFSTQLDGMKGELYSVVTSKDNELFDEVCANGYSVQKIVVSFQERT